MTTAPAPARYSPPYESAGGHLRYAAELHHVQRHDLGLNLQRLRREAGLPQEELADRSRVHQTYLSGVERGVRNPTVTVLQRIAQALGLDVEDMVRRR